MRCGTGLVVSILLLLNVSAPASAQRTVMPPIPDAEELVKHCWAISLEYRSSTSTGTISEGHEKTIECFRGAIHENMAIILKDPKMNHEGQTLEKLMEDVETSMRTFYDNLYQNNKACGFTCGSIWDNVYRTALAKFYEYLIREILEHRNFREKHVEHR